MAEDALIAGAAAPAGTRWIRSAPVLDSIWAIAVAALIIASSFFALVDVENPLFRTGAAPLRVYALGLPILAVRSPWPQPRRRSADACGSGVRNPRSVDSAAGFAGRSAVLRFGVAVHRCGDPALAWVRRCRRRHADPLVRLPPRSERPVWSRVRRCCPRECCSGSARYSW